MYFINEEIKPRLPELKQFTPYCPPKIVSMPRLQAGQCMAGCHAARLPGRAWLASQASRQEKGGDVHCRAAS